ncbi:hypothetical protein H2202_002670 [Exophiala xenobiotica]|nr:hypothetical protein H2202_002670 [Exophiala xenobiotica]KAK5204991.1 hypothetical protein LTR41_009201 [Exophiala xenobiotica]KAK5233223.1 hypothetical protein LTR47_005720 [Exophiala xenobiotica]KAK5250804.1 hypothetical protein LTS06_004512 [Exophiala xenobiotica]KAK5322567.1 hypothetical protein LTR93_005770 [Exophiala xenobiotica]
MSSMKPRSMVNGSARGTRPVRIANCSGGQMEPGWQMRKQATMGPVDFITGDWLAENNIAQEAAAMDKGTGEGFKKNCWEGLQLSMDAIAQKGIKVIVNGGGLGPQNLAKRCQELINKNNYDLTVAYVSGDNITGRVRSSLKEHGKLPSSFQDGSGRNHRDAKFTADEVLACTAYLGARAIVKALENNADIIICGRVADAAPIMGAAWWWYGWADTDYDCLAGAFLAGHIIECSAYASGSNFSGFNRFPLEMFIDSGFPIAEVEEDGACVITKHEGTDGMVTEETIKCQLLYEIQGNVYLNSDVKAVLDHCQIKQVGKDRVRLSNIKGCPPPPTTKLAVFFQGGYESQNLANFAGYSTRRKHKLYEKQIRARLDARALTQEFDVLEFQTIGSPRPNPRRMFESTTYSRIFAQAKRPEPLSALKLILADDTQQKPSGLHWAQDMRTADPKTFYVYYPCIMPQDEIEEAAHILDRDGNVQTFHVTRPSKYEDLEERESYDPVNPTPLESFGETVTMPLGNIVIGRSGDKGPNVNIGLFTDRAEIWEWFRSFLTIDRMKRLIGRDWEDEYRIERVEFPTIFAVHFVIYGILGRGVSSSTLLDNRGKGFTDYIRAKHVDVPKQFLQWTWEENDFEDE